MEDVIFAGTREKKPLGMASVTMTLVDPGAADPTGLMAIDVATEKPAPKASEVAEITRCPKRSSGEEAST